MLSFFESLANQLKAVQLLVDYGKQLVIKYSAKQLVVGIEGHCNNLLGLTKTNKHSICFGQPYNHSYYCNYFLELGFNEHKYLYFEDQLSNIDYKLLERLAKKSEKHLVMSNGLFKFGKIKSSIDRYTKLRNVIFDSAEHHYFYQRPYQEDYELFKGLVPLLNKDSLIIARNSEGVDIGFILWYYDFYELSMKLGVKDFINHKFLNKRPRRLQIVEIGVLPEYQNTGLVLALLKRVYDLNFGFSSQLELIMSSWIYEANLKSKNLTSKFIKNQSHEIFTYTLQLSDF